MDFIDGFFMIISAIVGALITLIGQTAKERYSKPQVDFEVRSKKVDSNGVIFKIYLVLHNKGRKSITSPRISFIKYDDDGNAGTDFNFTLDREISPKDYLFLEMGKITMEPSLDGEKLGGEDSV